MKHSIRSTLLALLLGCVGVRAAGDPEVDSVLPLSGADWRIHEDADGRGAERGMPEADASAPGWVPATVPGNVQADLEAAHRLTPLWYGAGDERLEGVARQHWWYRKDFVVPASFAGQRLTLVFEGVDYTCEVWLNGRKLGGNTGMFRRFWFEVGAAARPGQTNRLAVHIARIPEALAPLIVRTDGQGVVNDATHFLRGLEATAKTLDDLKSPTNWGWDWGVNIWTLGIWKDVRLEATGPARIDWTRVQTALNDDYTQATVTVTLEIDSETELPARARFRIAGSGPPAIAAVEAALKKGTNVVQAKLVLDRPALWWPNGHGEQPLYTLLAELEPAGGGTAWDARATRFGVRDLRWVHTEGAPADFVSRYQLIVNGRPVRTIGSNLIPPDLLFGRMGPRTLHLLRHAHHLGMNTLRLWGGGVILHEEAYDLADALGIMLVQELPLANHLPETNAVFLANLDLTARNIIRQVRNHPSIVEFDGGNEMPWNSLTQHPALERLRTIVNTDAGHLFRATCPDLGATHAPWFFDLRRDGRPSYDDRVTMRAGEFGSASPAHLEVWHRTIPPQSQWPVVGTADPIQIRKNLVQAVFETDYWLRKTFLEDVFGVFDDLPQMVEAGQFYGAEGLRYAVDALRRKGKRIGGLTTWDFDEPWPNGAGSFLVDHDGRALMSYDFFRQAIAPVSLSVRHNSVFYNPRNGLAVELFLTSDAPTATEVRWQWRARDRRGQVLDQGAGTASIAPIEVKSLGPITVKPPPKTAYGPLFLELRLEDAQGTLLGERLHLFGADGVRAPFAGLLRNREPDADDDGLKLEETIQLPNGPANLAFVGNGARPATASSARPEPIHQPAGLNDGKYGNQHSWIGTTPQSWFQIDLGKPATVGRFKLGRDRTGGFADRGLDSLKLEASLDGQAWQTVFERTGLTALPGFRPTQTLTIDVAPVEARFLRATVDARNPAGGELACIDEFEVYAPAPDAPATLPQVTCLDARPELWRPVRRTTLRVKAAPGPRLGEPQPIRSAASLPRSPRPSPHHALRVTDPRSEGRLLETLELTVENPGPMTALFCEPHPLIAYRTDLFIENNHCFIPPGESRTIVIRAAAEPEGGLGLAQTGWRLGCWNADDVVIEPDPDVLLALGRRDAMCREFDGYFHPHAVGEGSRSPVEVSGTRPDPAPLPYWLDGQGATRFAFPANDAQAQRTARLRLHTADQSARPTTRVVATLNGRAFEATLPAGLGVQRNNPPHLAFPATLEWALPAGCLRAGTNRLEVRVEGDGWFTWDALDLCLTPEVPPREGTRPTSPAGRVPQTGAAEYGWLGTVSSP